MENVFVWTDYQQWRKVILHLLNDFVDKAVLKEVRKNPPRHFASDNLEWLDRAIRKIKGIPFSNIHTALIEQFPTRYQFVRAFHGCRPVSIESYKEHGIMVSNPAVLNDLAFQIFQNAERIESAIKDLKTNSPSYPDHNQGKVFFCLTLEEFIEDCGHYLLYGSEYLGAIGFRIGQAETLRRRGRATVVECNIPMTDISGEYIKCLMGEILRVILRKYCLRFPGPNHVDFGFHISRNLDPQNIVGFHFPTGIRNSHNYSFRED